MSSPPPPPPPPRRSSVAMLDRLYVLWIVSSLLLVLLAVVLTLLVGGQLRRQATRITQQSQAIDNLRTELSEARRELDRLGELERISPRPQREPPASPIDEDSGDSSPAQRVPTEEDRDLPGTAAAEEPDMAALLRAALRPGRDLPFELADRAAAEAALRAASRTRPDGATCARLAIVARLLDRDAAAELFAAWALQAGETPHQYYETAARLLLARGQTAEAIVYAGRLRTARPGHADAQLLLAQAYALHGDPAAADLAIEEIDSASRLALADKLQLGRLLAESERWDRLAELLESLERVPRPVPPKLSLLRAMVAIRDGELPEALAILDNLVADYPDDYEFRTWRGVALLEARQFEAAREGLAHASDQPDRPEAWYWRGMLEWRAGKEDDAVPFFEHALAASQRFAPAWEALGTMALNAGDLPAALQNLTNAVNANPRRGSAHFLIAVIQARMSRAEQAAAALRTAFELDPALVGTARRTELFTEMFSPDELAALAGPHDAAPPDAQEAAHEVDRE